MTDVPDISQSLQRPTTFGTVWKRALDLLVAGAALVLLSPLLLASALAIKFTSPGPLLYLQPRRGRDGRIFSVIKLRTLRPELCDAPDASDVTPVDDNDPRVFPVGEFLRRYGLDEIPQLWNVVRGEMSIVGPRPHALPHDDMFLANVPGYAHRYAVNPGITGWAQVNGSRGKIHSLEDAADRVRLDREYIQTMSLFLDIVVMLRTFVVLVRGIDAKASPVAAAELQSENGTAAVRARHVPSLASGTKRDALHAGIGVIDQGITALGSLIPVVLLGRLAGATELGVYSLAASTALLVAIVTQSMFLSGYPIFRAQARAGSASHTFNVVVFGIVAQAALIPAYLGLMHWTSADTGFSGTAILTATAFVVATSLRSYLRTLSLVRRDMPRVLALDSVALLILSGLLAWLSINGTVSVWNVFIALAAANAIFAVLWAARYVDDMKISLVGSWRYLVRSVEFGRWALLGVGFGSMHYYLVPWLLAFVSGTSQVAVYAAASTVVGLANHGFLGLTRGIEARTAEAFHHGGIPALQDSLRRSIWIVVPALAAVVVVVWLAADLLGGLVLPGHADDTGIVARLLSLSLLVGSARVLFGNALWAMSMPRATIPADLVRGVVSIGAGILGAYYAGAVGCAMAVLLGDAISSLVVATRYQTEIRRRKRG